MKYIKIMILAIFLVSLLAVSAVSAQDNATSDVVGVEETTVDVVKETTNEVVSVENDNQVILGNGSNVGTFDELSSLIENTSEGATLELDKDYKYVGGSNGGIQINKAITIDGQGQTLDGNFVSCILNINGEVTLKNINFINSFTALNMNQGSAINLFSNNAKLINCTFINCSSKYGKGGALSLSGNHVNIIKSTFINCFADYGGGAIHTSADYTIIENCTFIKCLTNSYGGAIHISANYGQIHNSNFINCSSKTGDGGAIYWNNDHIDFVNPVLSNSSFKNCFSSNRGGAISVSGSNGTVLNCDFDNCTNKHSIFWYGSGSKIVNCSFSNSDKNNIKTYSDDLNIVKKITEISTNNISFNYKNSINFSAILDNKNICLFNQTIFLNIVKDDFNFEYIMITDDNGRITLNNELDNLTAGIWNVTMIFEGNDNYYPCNATVTITVHPLSSSVTIDDINTTWDQETTFNARVMSENKTINEGTVSFFIDDDFIGNIPVVNGTAILTHQAPGDAGNHIISAIFNSGNYLSSNNTAKMFVSNGNIDVEDYESIGTFNALNNLIKNIPEGGILNLTKNYIFVSGSNDGIQINKSITIDGQGHTLDGNQLSRIFNIQSENVVLKNIIFINAKHDMYGGAIRIDSNHIRIDSCIFENNTADRGGAIYAWNADDVTILLCNFTKNLAVESGAVDISGNCNNISYCNFLNNHGHRGGGLSLGSGELIFVSHCKFINNVATNNAGALELISASYGCVSDCIFINNSAIKKGHTPYGGAILFQNDDFCTLNNCTFYDNLASLNGNSVYILGCDDLNIFNCNFSNKINKIYGDFITSISSTVNIFNVYFGLDNNCINQGINNFINFTKHDLNIICEDLVFTYNNHSNFSIILESENLDYLVNKSVNFDIANYKFYKKFTNDGRNAYLFDELNDLTVGTWNVTVIFEGNDNYYPCNATATITVLPPSSSLTIDNVNTTVGHEITLVANVNSTELINEGVVSFFDGETNVGEANVVDGVATLTYAPETAGEHQISAIFSSDNYGSSNDTALLTVTKADVDLNIDYINDVYFTNPSNFAININSNSKPVNEGKIKYYVNNELVGTVDVYEGTANFDYVTNTTGSFTLTATYEETDNYFAKNASTTFVVNKMPTTLSGESVIFDEESYKTFTTELKDNNNYGVGGQPVKIEVIKYSGESATFNGISDANGITIYDVGRLAGGMWYVTGVYAGNDNYIESRFVDKFLVVRMNTTTEIEEIDNPKVNHKYKLKANIHDENGKLVKEGIVQFYLDGVDIGSIDLSNNQGHQSSSGDDVLGIANSMFEYVLGADNDVSDLYINYVPTKAGKHTLTAVYEGTTIYKASNSTTSFDVSNSNTVETTITASDVTTVYNGGKYIVITLKDVNGKLVNGVKVKVVLNKKTYTSTTKNGQVKISTNGLAPVKTYAAKITFAGNSKYDKATKSVKVSVKKATPKLTAKAKTFKKSVKTKNFVVTLKTNQNKVMKNTKVTLKVNGKTYSAKTNTKGQATFKITKLTKKGKFTATIKYAGSKYYNAKTVKAKITVK